MHSGLSFHIIFNDMCSTPGRQTSSLTYPVLSCLCTYKNIPMLGLVFLFTRKAMHLNSLKTCGQTCVETRCYSLIICNVTRIIVVFYSTSNMQYGMAFFCQTTQLESPKATTPLTLNYRMSYMIQCCHQSESSFAGVQIHSNAWLLVVKRNV